MAERPAREDGQQDARREQLAERRHRHRRRTRLQRLAAAVALAAAAAVIVAIALGGGSSAGRHGDRAAPPPAAGEGKPPSALVRNATPQAGWRPYRGPVPILEYHVLGAPPPGTAYPELFVGRDDFRRQLNWLDQAGYQAVTLEQVEEAWDGGGTLPPKPVVLSFDDGYRPQFTYALPELRKHGWAGVLNLKAEGSDLYTSNVEAMLAAGWELASHTIHHLDLTTLSGEQLREEVAGARSILQREYGVPVKNFCYPAGRFDSGVIAAVKAAGYVGATTEIPGYATREAPYELARFEILRSSGVQGLTEDLRTGP